MSVKTVAWLYPGGDELYARVQISVPDLAMLYQPLVLRSDLESAEARAQRAEQALAKCQADADRYRFLRDCFYAADFEWGEPPINALVFKWPDVPVGANLDDNVDAARAIVEGVSR